MPPNDSVAHSEYFPRKIAMLLSSEAIGGEERYFIELAIAMQRTYVKPILINLKANLPYEAELQRHSVSLFKNVAPNRFDIFAALKIMRILKDISPDVLIINGNRQAIWLGSIFGRCIRIPVVLIHTHAHMEMYSFTLKINSIISDAVIAAANDHRLYLQNVYKLKAEKVLTVYPGIDQRRTRFVYRHKTSDSSENKFWTIGIIAALRPEKDHENFLRAAALVREQIPGSQFVVIGDGPRRRFLENLAQKIGLGPSVIFLGWQRVDGVLLNKLDVLVLSSYSETFPAVLIEAFSAGVPVVATSVGSVPELIGSNLCGLLVPPRNPRALANALISLFQDPKMYKKIILNALKRAEFFSGDRFCEDILELARNLSKKKFKNSR